MDLKSKHNEAQITFPGKGQTTGNEMKPVILKINLARYQELTRKKVNTKKQSSFQVKKSIIYKNILLNSFFHNNNSKL